MLAHPVCWLTGVFVRTLAAPAADSVGSAREIARDGLEVFRGVSMAHLTLVAGRTQAFKDMWAASLTLRGELFKQGLPLFFHLLETGRGDALGMMRLA